MALTEEQRQRLMATKPSANTQAEPMKPQADTPVSEPQAPVEPRTSRLSQMLAEPEVREEEEQVTPEQKQDKARVASALLETKGVPQNNILSKIDNFAKKAVPMYGATSIVAENPKEFGKNLLEAPKAFGRGLAKTQDILFGYADILGDAASGKLVEGERQEAEQQMTQFRDEIVSRPDVPASLKRELLNDKIEIDRSGEPTNVQVLAALAEAGLDIATAGIGKAALTPLKAGFKVAAKEGGGEAVKTLAKGVAQSIKASPKMAAALPTVGSATLGGAYGATGTLQQESPEVGDIVQNTLIGMGIGAALPIGGKFLTKNVPPAVQKIDSSTQAGKVIAKNATPEMNTFSGGIVERMNRVTPTQSSKFATESGTQMGEWLTQRGIVGSPEETVNILADRMRKSMDEADKGMAKIGGTYKDKSIEVVINDLYEMEQALAKAGGKGRDKKMVEKLRKNYNKSDGLTMREINSLKRIYERNVKTEYIKDATKTSTDVKVATNKDSNLREFQRKIAEEKGFDDLKAINNETRFSKMAADAIGEYYLRRAGNNAVSITDWITASAAATNPQALAMLVGKKGAESNWFQSALAKATRKGEIKPIPTADIEKIERKAKVLEQRMTKEKDLAQKAKLQKEKEMLDKDIKDAMTFNQLALPAPKGNVSADVVNVSPIAPRITDDAMTKQFIGDSKTDTTPDLPQSPEKIKSSSQSIVPETPLKTKEVSPEKTPKANSTTPKDSGTMEGMKNLEAEAKKSPYKLRGSAQIQAILPGSKHLEKLTPKQENTLIAVHNLTSDKLKFAEKIGGHANPSIAVIDTSVDGFDNFGDITMIMKDDLITSNKAKTYAADVYSPRFPNTKIITNYDGIKSVEKELSLPSNNMIDWENPRDWYYSKDIREAVKNDYSLDMDLNKVADTPEMKETLAYIYDNVVKEEKIFLGFTNSGNRKYAALTAENASKLMNKEATKGGENYFYGLGSVRARIAPEFKSSSQIRKNKGLLVSDKEFEKVKKSYEAEFESLTDELSKYSEFSDFGAYSQAGEDIGNALSGNLRVLDEYPNLPRDFKTRLRLFGEKLEQMPTEYFETKFKRVVDTDEFSAAIVPKGTDKKTIGLLEKKGVKVTEYDPSVDGDRLTQLKKAAAEKGLLFGLGIIGYVTLNDQQ